MPASEHFLQVILGIFGKFFVFHTPHRQSKRNLRTILECAPLSNQAYVYRKLARRIMERKDPALVLPLDEDVLRQWGKEWGELLLELESGMVRDGAAI
ncbi:MAG: hypothetical protein HYS23_04185 [Geobacter sp.]|nr:hypothetical protein [Geobacter sp.]